MLSPLRLDIDEIPTSPLPIDLGLVRLHCAVDASDQDALLEEFVIAAIRAFEGTTHRTVVRRQHRWTLKDFERRPGYRVWLPRGRTVSVDQIDYIDPDGDPTTLLGPTSDPVGAGYREEFGGDMCGSIMPPRGETWPAVDCEAPSPVVITFTAGYTAEELPRDILNALLFYIRTSLDDNRSDPQKTAANLAAFETMCSGWRISMEYA